MTTRGPLPVLTQRGRQLLVLLVDRDADTRNMYAEYLRRTGCTIDEAGDGREALAKAMTSHPDVIVTAKRLARIGGYDLCRLLRGATTTSEIPIVILTGDAYEVDVRHAQIAGADVVLTKPCLPEQLAHTIHGVFRQGVERSAQRSTRAKPLKLRDAHLRRVTTEPPFPPPALVCPTCLQKLKYLKSHVGALSVQEPEQWDYFECGTGCGTFQYRQRTQKLRRVT